MTNTKSEIQVIEYLEQAAKIVADTMVADGHWENVLITNASLVIEVAKMIQKEEQNNQHI